MSINVEGRSNKIPPIEIRSALRLGLWNEVSIDYLLQEINRLGEKKKRLQKHINEELERTQEKINSIELYLTKSTIDTDSDSESLKTEDIEFCEEDISD
jgi:hypothetical protein